MTPLHTIAGPTDLLLPSQIPSRGSSAEPSAQSMNQSSPAHSATMSSPLQSDEVGGSQSANMKSGAEHVSHSQDSMRSSLPESVGAGASHGEQAGQEPPQQLPIAESVLLALQQEPDMCRLHVSHILPQTFRTRSSWTAGLLRPLCMVLADVNIYISMLFPGYFGDVATILPASSLQCLL